MAPGFAAAVQGSLTSDVRKDRLMDRQPIRLGILGYGEIGHGLALGLGKEGLGGIVALARSPESMLTKERIAASGARLVATPAELARSADIIIAVTQGTESLGAAKSIAGSLGPQHRYIELASATPGEKQEIAAVLASSGALVADGAIEGSPLEHGHRFPVIVSGPAAQAFHDALVPWGMKIRIVGEILGQASAIKTLRHNLTNGLIALLIETAVAEKRLGIRGEVLSSVAEWVDELPFMDNATRLLRTTTIHARRRTEEVQMAENALRGLGMTPLMAGSAAEVLDKVARLNLRDRLGGVVPARYEDAVDLLEEYLKA
jgi:3-hydroxyisobutyrate dehydrogenase-like beta-hydroxyacid dehydrogenase